MAPVNITFRRVVDVGHWNSFLGCSDDGNIFQTAHWAAFIQAYTRRQPVFLEARREDTGDVVGALLAFRVAPIHLFFLERPLDRLILLFLMTLMPIYEWQHGPVCIECDCEREGVSRALIDALDHYALGNRALVVSGGPVPTYGEAGGVRFQLPAFSTKRHATLLVDLRPDETTLWKKLRSSARKAIRRAERDGISIERIASEQQLREYYAAAAHWTEQSGRRVFSYGNLSVMWKYLRPHGSVELFAARHQGEMIGGLGIWVFNGILYEFWSWQSERSFREKLYGNDLIKWEVIRRGHAQGHRVYDLAGVAPNPANTKEAGIRRFKEKWGGRYIPYMTYEKVNPGLRTAALSSAKWVVNWVMKRWRG